MTDTAADSIFAAVRAGAPAEAERLCRIYLQRRPDSSEVLVLLGLSLQQQGKSGGALETFAQLTRLHPEDANHWGNYATALRSAGDLIAAERAAQTAVRLAPGDPERLDQLGVLQLQLGHPLAARETLLRAFGNAPDSILIRIDAARACAACRDYRAEQLLQPWRTWLPLENELQFDLASLFAQLGEADNTLELLEGLVQRAPSHDDARLMLAAMYERVNRLEDAQALLERFEADVAANSRFHSQIAHQRAQLATRTREFAKARALLEHAGPRDDTDYIHWFELAAVYDRLGEVSATMAALETAHAGQVAELRASAPHCFESDADIFPRAKWRVSAEEYQAWPELIAPDTAQSPVFVVGFPRSGTTLLEQMLDAHPHFQSMDERPFFNFLSNQLNDVGIEVSRDLAKLTQRDCDELRKGYVIMACSKVPRTWNSRLVDKNPMNMLWLPMIHRLFPRAKFILAIRHPCDVILSCYMQNFRSIPLCSASLTLERLAHAYIAAMESWLYHVDVFQPTVFLSRYEELVADPVAQTRRIAAFLDIDDAEPMLNSHVRAREKGYIKTPSYTQVIEPINSRAMGRWHRYREYFEPVLPILQPMLEHWGYAADHGVVAAAR